MRVDPHIAGSVDSVRRYHDGTKHAFHRYARSLGYLDWASQPSPFRAFRGAPTLGVYPAPDAPGDAGAFPYGTTYDRLFETAAGEASPLSAAAIGDLLRHSLGLSAWKSFRETSWSLRVNPSSGNLHPTEAYLVMDAVEGLSPTAGVWHYAPDRHALERRCDIAEDRLPRIGGGPESQVLIVLTSIHWRESWKYGERAFRYCQHDLGHAVAAISLSARLHGWQVRMVSDWSHDEMAALIGLDRDEDYVDAEREEPGCLLVIDVAPTSGEISDPDRRVLEMVRHGTWFGTASQLSEDHVQWSFIDEAAEATRVVAGSGWGHTPGDWGIGRGDSDAAAEDRHLDARSLILQRRSAVALDGVSSTDRASFLRMLARTLPGPGAPWDAMWWSPRISLAIFVHRVAGMEPGLYFLARSPGLLSRVKAASDSTFVWQQVAANLPLWLLRPGDHRQISKRVSCDQDIASDGFFSLGMIADFDASLSEFGAPFYRQLFWESGVVGQVLYLEAEAAGARATGIGCFFDDAVHEVLGMRGHAFQSLYHFTIGAPVEDGRLTTRPAYAWERG